jgi:hypothetical protein
MYYSLKMLLSDYVHTVNIVLNVNAVITSGAMPAIHKSKKANQKIFLRFKIHTVMSHIISPY